MSSLDIITARNEKSCQLSLHQAINQSCFKFSDWYHAISITERIASIRAVQRKRVMNSEVNTELAERRMQRWRSQYPFTSDTYFRQRLEMDGISEEEFLYLLGEPIGALRDRLCTTPTWLTDLVRAFFPLPSSNSIPFPGALRGEGMVGFLNALDPLIHQALNQLHEGVQALIQTDCTLPFTPDTIADILCANLPRQLLMMLSRTMVLELNIARLKDLLEGDTAEERFQSFLDCLRQRDTVLPILQEYPVLARQLTIYLNNWVHCSLEFLHHLCADWEAIRGSFSLENDPGVLVAVDGDMGDKHRGGRSVLIAKFSSGFQVVYKPKSLAVDVHFQELLSWINDRGNHPPFRTLKILDRGTYGWVEFVLAQGCSSVEEIQRFYERQGGYLALLYVLEATDFHSENLIACSEHPVLIDLEALFHPRLNSIDVKQASHLAISTLNDSVLSVGLLPYRAWSNGKSEGIDISGLGAGAGQLTPYGIPQWEGVATDEMRLVRNPVEMPAGRNKPTFNGAEVDALDYAEAITVGFTRIYQLLLKHRDELLSDNGLLSHFAEDEVRVIIRPTLTYSSLLYESFHPDMLRNALDRDRLFDRLWIGIEHSAYLAKTIPAEYEDLQRGDVPMFTTRPNSRDLWSSTNQRIVNFFDEPSMTLVQRRVQQLSEADLKKQLWFIHASLTTLSAGADQIQSSTFSFTEPQSVAEREQLLAAARSVGDRLEALALRGEDDVAWLGLTFINKRYRSLVPLRWDLYDGVPGVALFLAYLGAITLEERYTTLANTALTTLQRQVEQDKSYITSIGGFSGWGGVIYTLTHLGVLWEQPDLLTDAEAVVQLLPALIEQDEQFDIISGAAGCIGSLLTLYHCQPSLPTLSAAIQCGDYLIAKAQRMEHGIGWIVNGIGTKPLTGFSHGSAGIAWALLDLAALTGEKRFRTVALEALAYERYLFLPKVGNWPDLRNFANKVWAGKNNQHICMTAWCHGAPGIGLARLRALPHLDNPETRAEIDIALKTTLARGFGGNHSLCHGDLGNLELLLQASQTLDNPQWRVEADRIAAAILSSIDQYGYRCGVPLEVETPGLMTGLAGIGYGLLRLAEPMRVPSVLTLEPPKLHV